MGTSVEGNARDREGAGKAVDGDSVKDREEEGGALIEPILFIHGLGCTQDIWQPQHELSTDFKLIMPNLRGHGDSDITYDITLENFARDMWELVDDQITICGHSLGGLVAQEMYKQQPSRVKRLILANTYSYYVPGFSDFAYYSRWIKFNSLSMKDYLEETIDNCLYDKTKKEQARQGFHIRKDTYLKACHAGAYANYRKLEIDLPTLIISSSHDRVIKPFVQQDMHKMIGGSNLVTIERCGHLSNIEKPNEFNAAIRNFMGR